MNEEREDPRAGGRPHCLVFAEEALPSVLFRDREQFVDYLRGPTGQSALEMLWDQAGAVVIERNLGVGLPGKGLVSEAVEGNGWRGAVIHLPDVQEPGESSLVLVAVPNGPRGGLWQLYEERGAPLARLFLLKLLKLAETDAPEFKICELSPLLGHVTTGYSCGENAADFVREVVDCLDLE